MKEQIDIIRDLLVEFDEMGFVPSVPTPNNEAYAIKWRDEITKALVDCFKQKEGEWIGQADGYADGELVYDVWYCSECNHCIDDGTDDADLLPNFCPNCGAKMKGGAE